MTVLWSAAWIPLGVVLSSVDRLSRGAQVTLGTVAADLPALAITGALSGFAFGLVLAATQRHRAFARMSVPRVVAWGIVSALITPLLIVALTLQWATLGNAAAGFVRLGIMGAATAAGTIAIARRAPAEALESGRSAPRIE